MTVVVDANLVAALVLPLSYSDATTAKMTAWKQTGAALYAPLLLEYEVASALRKAVNVGMLTTLQAIEAMDNILAVNIECVRPTRKLHEKALHWADRLGHSRIYDAQYLAVAEQMRLPLWTADQRLVNGARDVGVTWVHWIGET
jgi:predicted nucleic acid-binding protein